jgi:hypothetical protein
MNRLTFSGAVAALVCRSILDTRLSRVKA